MTSTRTRATPMAPDERRKAIIDAVIPLLVEYGDGVTTKLIAEAAGIAEGTIFRVFPDKRALLIAAAQESFDPEGGQEQLAAAILEHPDLAAKLAFAIERMVERMERGMVVLMALRAALMKEPPTGEPPGPPAFIRQANERLLEVLATSVFAPHADDLRVAPERAALVLRSLVFGTWHPGMHEGDRLSNAEIADAVLHGVGRSRC